MQVKPNEERPFITTAGKLYIGDRSTTQVDYLELDGVSSLEFGKSSWCFAL